MENSSSHDPKSGNDQNISFSHRRFLAPIKLFECKYCARKFLNSKALGGHQNAHKKEKTLWMMGLHEHKKPLRMEPYHKPIQGVVDQDLTSWPGTFRIESTDPNEGSSNGEALNLELVLGSQKPDQSKLEACELDLDLRL